MLVNLGKVPIVFKYVIFSTGGDLHARERRALPAAAHAHGPGWCGYRSRVV